MNFVFSDFELDSERAELRHAGQPVRVEPQVFDLLRLLVGSSNRLVTREEIFEEIWGDRVVSDAALSSRVRDARKALGDDGTTQKFIQTVQRRGLRFVGDVEARQDEGDRAGQDTSATQYAVHADPFERPSVAVLPFEDLSENAGTSMVSRSITDELIAALSAWRYFPVVSRQSAAQVEHMGLSARDIGEKLNARYLVAGTFRQNGNRIKVQVSITDTQLDTQIWSERILCDADTFFDFEEEIAAQIATLVEPELESAEARRILRKPRSEMSVWELTMRAAAMLGSAKRSDFSTARDLAREAADRAPDWVLPHTLIATAEFQLAMTAFSAADSAQAFAPTLEAAKRALGVDHGAWVAHALTAVGELWTHRNHDKALLHVERAIELNPSASVNYHFGGCITGFAGNPERARNYQERLFRIDPTYAYRAVIEADLALWHLLEQDYDAAKERLDRSQTWDATYGRALQRRIALCGLTGDRDGAQTALKSLADLGLPLDAKAILASYPFRNPDHAELFSEGLRRSGMNA